MALLRSFKLLLTIFPIRLKKEASCLLESRERDETLSLH